MNYMRQFAVKTYYYLISFIAFQFFVLFFKNLSLLPLYTIIEYMQLASYLPLLNYRLIPYLYDAFKPFLVSHLVLTNDAYVLKEMEDQHFNINYDYYWLNIAKMGQAIMLVGVGFAIIVSLHFLIGLLYCMTPESTM